MRIGRRSLFFAALALVCVLLLPPTPAEYRWVDLAAAGLSGFWATMIGIEDLLTARRSTRAQERK